MLVCRPEMMVCGPGTQRQTLVGFGLEGFDRFESDKKCISTWDILYYSLAFELLRFYDRWNHQFTQSTIPMISVPACAEGSD